MKNAARKYEADSADPTATEVAALLHEEAIEHISLAIGAIEAGDIETRCNAVNHASEIVAMLHLSLDYRNGGETAEQMGTVYRIVLANLLRVNFRNDALLAHQLIEILRPLCEAWRVVSQSDDEAAAASGNPAFLQRFNTANQMAQSVTP